MKCAIHKSLLLNYITQRQFQYKTTDCVKHSHSARLMCYENLQNKRNVLLLNIRQISRYFSVEELSRMSVTIPQDICLIFANYPVVFSERNLCQVAFLGTILVFTLGKIGIINAHLYTYCTF